MSSAGVGVALIVVGAENIEVFGVHYDTQGFLGVRHSLEFEAAVFGETWSIEVLEQKKRTGSQLIRISSTACQRVWYANLLESQSVHLVCGNFERGIR